MSDVSLAALIEVATDLSWTNNPFHRLITAHAIIAGTPLLTANPTILENLPQAVWD